MRARGRWSGSTAVVVVWSVLLTALILAAALGPGYVLVRDLVWVPDLGLTHDALGLASGLPRAVPSDAVVAVADEVVPGTLLEKLVLVVPLVAAGAGALALLAGRSVVTLLVGCTALMWNPFVAERLAMGHWPVLACLGVLPWLVQASRQWRRCGEVPPRLLWLAPLGALSASAGLATAVVLLAFGCTRGRVVRVALVAVAVNAPWLLTGLLHSAHATSDPAGARVFALHGEGSVPAPIAALTLGGIWNADVVPVSRTGVTGWLAAALLVGLASVGLPGWWRSTAVRDRAAYVGCWSVGYLAAVLTWAAPGTSAAVASRVPGGGLLRDGSRLLLLCAPLLVVLLAHGAEALFTRLPDVGAARVAGGAALVLAPLALLPSLALGDGGQLRAVSYPPSYDAARSAVSSLPADQDVLVLPLGSYRAPAWNHGVAVLDPMPRYLDHDTVASDTLVVGGVALAGEDPQVVDAAAALRLPTQGERSAALAALGVGAVIVERDAPGAAPSVAGHVLLDDADVRVVRLPGVTPRPVPASWRVVTAAGWTGYLAVPVTGGLLLGRRWRRRRTRRTRART